MDSSKLSRSLTDLAAHYGQEAVWLEAQALFAPAIPSSPVRGTDPETSVAGAVKRSTSDVSQFADDSKAAHMLRMIAREPSTAVEAALQLAASITTTSPPLTMVETYRKRVSELHRAGYVEDSGERRRNPQGGAEAIVWRVTNLGQLAIVRAGRTGWTRPRKQVAA